MITLQLSFKQWQNIPHAVQDVLAKIRLARYSDVTNEYGVEHVHFLLDGPRLVFDTKRSAMMFKLIFL